MGFRSYFDSSSSGGGGGTPGGVNGDLQYNNAGAFGGLTPGVGVATLLAGTPSGTGGLAGTTSPTFTTGITLNGAGSGVSIAVTSSSANDFMRLSPKGSGQVVVGPNTPSNLSGSYFGGTQINPLWATSGSSGIVAFVVQGSSGQAIQFINNSNVATADFGATGGDVFFVNRPNSGHLYFNYFNPSGQQKTGLEISYRGVGIGADTATVAYTLQVAPVHDAIANQTMLVQDAGASGSTGIFFNAGASQSANPVLTVQGSNSIQAAGTVKGTLTTLANAVTGLVAGALAALTNASLVLTDGTGTVYRIPCVTP